MLFTPNPYESEDGDLLSPEEAFEATFSSVTDLIYLGLPDDDFEVFRLNLIDLGNDIRQATAQFITYRASSSFLPITDEEFTRFDETFGTLNANISTQIETLSTLLLEQNYRGLLNLHNRLFPDSLSSRTQNEERTSTVENLANFLALSLFTRYNQLCGYGDFNQEYLRIQERQEEVNCITLIYGDLLNQLGIDQLSEEMRSTIFTQGLTFFDLASVLKKVTSNNTSASLNQNLNDINYLLAFIDKEMFAIKNGFRRYFEQTKADTQVQSIITNIREGNLGAQVQQEYEITLKLNNMSTVDSLREELAILATLYLYLKYSAITSELFEEFNSRLPNLQIPMRKQEAKRFSLNFSIN